MWYRLKLFFFVPPLLILFILSALFIFSSQDERKHEVYFLNLSTGNTLINSNEEFIKKTAIPIGSLIKPFVLFFALNKGLIDKNSSFYCSESRPEVPEHSRCWYSPGHGKMNAVQALANSCNVFFMELSGRINFNEFLEFISKCGFNLNSIESINDSIKKRMAVTGISEELRIVPAILISSYKEMLEDPQVFMKRTGLLFNEKQADDSLILIKEGMRGSVLYGTSSTEFNPGLEGLLIYGKTGTVRQVFSDNQNKERTSGLFFGFCDIYGEKLAVFIFLYDGKGSDAAGIGLGYFREYLKNLSD